jgi:hypothetical protein
VHSVIEPPPLVALVAADAELELDDALVVVTVELLDPP